MGILDSLLNDQNIQIINQLAENNGIDNSDVQNVIQQVLPALSKGIKNNISQEGGLNELIETLSSGHHQRYLEQPEALADESAAHEGNAILGHVLGNKEVSRDISMQVTQETGIDNSIVKKLLPLIATTVMASLSKEVSNSALGGVGNSDLSRLLGDNSSPIIDMMSSFLDSDKESDITDDLLNLAKRFF